MWRKYLVFNRVLIYYDGDQLSVYNSRNRELYLCLYLGETSFFKRSRYLTSHISEENLYRLETGKITLRNAFCGSDELRYGHMCRSGLRIKLGLKRSLRFISNNHLPEEGFYLYE